MERLHAGAICEVQPIEITHGVNEEMSSIGGFSAATM